MMASLDLTESMEEDFTGFDEEPVSIVPNSGGTALLQESRTDEAINETDSDSGNLVIAEPNKRPDAKSAEKSPRKRKSRVEDITPTRTPSSRVRGQGLAYLLAMEKGGSKKQLAKVQAQTDSHDTPSSSQTSENQSLAQSEVDPPETEKKKSAKESKESAKSTKETTKVLKEKEPSVSAVPVNDSQHTPVVKPAKSTARKSYSAVNISSPLLKEPFKEGDFLSFFSSNVFENNSKLIQILT